MTERTPFQVLEGILQQKLAEENGHPVNTVLYGFRGYQHRIAAIFAFSEGVHAVNDTASHHVCMSFDDDLYDVFAPTNVPEFCKWVEDDGEEHPYGMLFTFESWVHRQLFFQHDHLGRPIEGATVVRPTLETAYLHLWNGKTDEPVSKSGTRLPIIPLYSADARTLREFLTDLEHKIPLCYTLCIPGMTYELNTNIKSRDAINSRLSVGTGSGSADLMIRDFGEQSRAAEAKIALIQPYHEEIKAFVAGARVSYNEALNTKRIQDLRSQDLSHGWVSLAGSGTPHARSESHFEK